MIKLEIIVWNAKKQSDLKNSKDIKYIWNCEQLCEIPRNNKISVTLLPQYIDKKSAQTGLELGQCTNLPH